MIGQSVSDILDMGLLPDDSSPEDPDLRTTVTIAVSDYLEALNKAFYFSAATSPR